MQRGLCLVIAVTWDAQIDALQDHIEKLLTHLKHEAAAKAKAIEASRRAERELQLLKTRNSALTKRNSSREQVITELKVRPQCKAAAVPTMPMRRATAARVSVRVSVRVCAR